MNKDNVTKSVQRKLFELQDVEYRDFHARLMPTVEKEKIIGIRIPVLRKFAKEYAKSEDTGEFIKILPHDYYEENNLHGFLIEGIKDYEECIRALDIFLPYVDNWATCDIIAPKVFKKHFRNWNTKSGNGWRPVILIPSATVSEC